MMKTKRESDRSTPKKSINFFLIPVIALIIISALASLVPLSSGQNSSQWSMTTSYPQGIDYGSCVDISGYVYCIGGLSGSGITNSVYFAALSSLGGISGNWSSTTPYPLNIEGQSCVASSGYVYCVGGKTNNGLTSDVYYSQASPQGLGNWIQTAAYPITTAYSSCSVASSYIYCITGRQIGNNTVYYAQLSPSGGIAGNWMQTSSYGDRVTTQNCVIDLSYMYCVGGDDNLAFYAPVSSSGVGSWVETTSYPTIIGDFSCVIYSDSIYCIGGFDGSGQTSNEVYSTGLSQNGLGEWLALTPYPATILGESCIEDSGYIYCFGGWNGSTVTSSVYFVEIAQMQTLSTVSSSSSTSGGISSSQTLSTQTGVTVTLPIETQQQQSSGSGVGSQNSSQHSGLTNGSSSIDNGVPSLTSLTSPDAILFLTAIVAIAEIGGLWFYLQRKR